MAAKRAKGKRKRAASLRGSQPPAAAGSRQFRLQFFTSAEGERWKHFFPILAAGFLLRVLIGLSGDWVVRPDEVYQYLEQAHRAVFGYGQVTWEFRLGARSWLLPAMSVLPLWMCKALGADAPWIYIPAVKIWHVLLSMAIPAGMYLFGRRVLGEQPARIALLLGCFWHEFAVLASHAFAEHYAAIFFFAALILLVPQAGLMRLAVAGLLLGLAVAFRPPYLPTVGVFGLCLLIAYPKPIWRWLTIASGGAAALLAFGAIDYLTQGRWWHSTRLYLDLLLFNDLFSELRPDSHLPRTLVFQYLIAGSYGLYALALLALPLWRKVWPVLLPALFTVATHYVFPGEYSNTFIAWPMLWMLIAAASCHLLAFARIRHSERTAAIARYACLAAAATASLAVFLPGIPRKEVNYNAIHVNEDLFVGSENSMLAAIELASLPPEEVRAVAWLAGPVFLHLTGGYYYLHHRVPILFPRILDYHAELVADKPPQAYASHIIAPAQAEIPGFDKYRQFGGLALFASTRPEAVDLPHDFATDLIAPEWAGTEEFARRKGIEFFEPQPALLHEPQE